MTIGYARVSTDDQNPTLLLYEIIAISCFRLKRRCVPLGRYKG
jgi:DNA invertase Pin-like site-specific DNA recombinase